MPLEVEELTFLFAWHTADHLGWFNSDDLTQGGKYKTIEALLAAKGEEVGRAKVNPDGTLEVEKVEAE